MKTKKLKRDKIAKITSRIALIVMCFMLIVPLGVSAAYFEGETLTLINTNNIPQDFTFQDPWIYDHELSFGDNLMNGEIITIKNGVAILTGPSHGFDTTVPTEYDGQYLQIYFNATSPIDYNATFVPVDPLYITTNGTAVLAIMDDAIFNVEVYEQNGTQTSFRYCVLVKVPSPTTPILDVWTGITNWITSSLNSVLGLFWDNYSDNLVEGAYTLNDTITELPNTFNANGDLKFSVGASTIIDQLYMEGDFLKSTDLNGVITSVYDYRSGTFLGGYTQYITVVNPINDAPFAKWFIENTNYAEVNNLTATGHLTFLGTIIIIGVSIACAFLIIGIIQRFLKLRG